MMCYSKIIIRKEDIETVLSIRTSWRDCDVTVDVPSILVTVRHFRGRVERRALRRRRPRDRRPKYLTTFKGQPYEQPISYLCVYGKSWELWKFIAWPDY